MIKSDLFGVKPAYRHIKGMTPDFAFSLFFRGIIVTNTKNMEKKHGNL